jgi:hypothetical protein
VVASFVDSRSPTFLETCPVPAVLSITFVVPVAVKGDVLRDNFLSSPGLAGFPDHELLVQENFPSAALAFNDAILRSSNDLIAFIHQDVILPANWPAQLSRAIGYLDRVDPNWGVLGCWGVTRNANYYGHIHSNGLGTLGHAFKQPVAVQTLDEIVLILRKSSGLRFDDKLPHFHLHGSDICLEAARQGRKSYAISAFCTHNNFPYTVLPREFYECYSYVKRKWAAHLPIQTSCIRITRFDFPMRRRRLQEAYLRYVRHKESFGARAKNVNALLEEVGGPMIENSAGSPSNL